MFVTHSTEFKFAFSVLRHQGIFFMTIFSFICIFIYVKFKVSFSFFFHLLRQQNMFNDIFFRYLCNRNNESSVFIFTVCNFIITCISFVFDFCPIHSIFPYLIMLTHYHTVAHFDALKIYSCRKRCEKRRNCL